MAYGLLGGKLRIRDIAWSVCDCLGNGANNTALDLIKETIGAETNHGEYKDNTLYAGMGIAQLDKIGFDDVKARTRDKHKNSILAYYDIDINLVQWEELRYNPLLSLLFVRLKYKLVPEEIPTTLEGRAEYWKKYYNTSAGKGTVEHYVKSNTE